MVNKGIIIHVPHSSDVIPTIFRDLFLLSDEALRTELLCMTDWFTDELFLTQYDILKFPYSRLVCDVERFLAPEEECMVSKGMGMYYTYTHNLKPMKKSPFMTAEGLVYYGIALKMYQMHHHMFTQQVENELAKNGKCLIIDAHSFPSKALPYEGNDVIADRPDFCIGADEFFTSAKLLDSTCSYFENRGFMVSVNYPFSGSIVPEPYYSNKDKRIQSVMVEVNRSLYMNEKSGEKLDSFKSVHQLIAGFIDDISYY